MQALKSRKRLLAVVAVVLLAAVLRGWAALRLPVDYDEPVYLQAGLHYAGALRAGDLDALIDYAENREHPALGKLLYGMFDLALGEDVNWEVALYSGRLLSAVLGTLAVLALALVDPLAGGLLAVHTLAIKYTGQVYLEALPHLASLGAVLAFTRSTQARDRWFWLSAVALGATGAAKFTYAPVAIVLLYLFWEKRFRWPNLLLYGAAALGAFWALNPTLWHEPLTRLGESLFFHVRYSQGARVDLAGLPWTQPLYWITRSPPSIWHPDVFFYPGLDGLITLAALPGLYWSSRQRRWVIVWFVAGLLFLLVWPTKWPQYTLILTPALCLSAATAVKALYGWLREQEEYWSWLSQMFPRPPLSFWIIIGALGLAVAVGYTAATLEMTLGRLGWSHLTTRTSQLPSNAVYDVIADARPGQEATMVLATEHGAALWSPPPATDLPDQWLIYTQSNSGLPGDQVLAVAQDGAGRLWFGTDGGVAGYDGQAWVTYRPADLGLPQTEVYALAVGGDGRLWAGTRHGAGVLEGDRWQAFTAANSGLVGSWVRAIAIQAGHEDDVVWFATEGGVSRLETATGEWSSFTAGFGEGVLSLLLDRQGRLWAGTQGAGLGLWDGDEWTFYRTGNSGIPFNMVTALAEVEPGVLWVGTALAAEVGGALAQFDGDTWKELGPRNSGYSGAEPLAMAQDANGSWWIGTRTAGVDIRQARR